MVIKVKQYEFNIQIQSVILISNNRIKIKMILDGNFYKVQSQGWTNEGMKSINFKEQIKQLPIFSRCNILLKNQRLDKKNNKQQDKIQPIKQIHCFSPSLSNNSERQSETQDKLKVKLIKKIIQNTHQTSFSEVQEILNQFKMQLNKNKEENISEYPQEYQDEKQDTKNTIQDYQEHKISLNQKQKRKVMKIDLEYEKKLQVSLQNNESYSNQGIFKNQQNIQNHNQNLKFTEKQNKYFQVNNSNNCKNNSNYKINIKDEDKAQNSKINKVYNITEETQNQEHKKYKKISSLNKSSSSSPCIDDDIAQRIKTRQTTKKVNKIKNSQLDQQLYSENENYEEQIYQIIQSKKEYYRKLSNLRLQKEIKKQIRDLKNKGNQIQTMLLIKEENRKRIIAERNLLQRQKQLEISIKENEILKNLHKNKYLDKQNQQYDNQTNHRMNFIILFILGLLVIKIFLF